jgi:transcriptional regulator with XRE-family HTH domain
MDPTVNSQELEQQLGERLRQLRLLKNIDQVTLAEQAGVSLNALKHLESGKGARVASLIKVLRALQMLKTGSRVRKRARRRARPRV